MGRYLNRDYVMFVEHGKRHARTKHDMPKKCASQRAWEMDAILWSS